MNPIETFEAQYKDAIAQAGLLELKMRLLADREPSLKSVSHRELKDVEGVLVKFAETLGFSIDTGKLGAIRVLRNKLFHGDFQVFRSKLESLEGASKKETVTQVTFAPGPVRVVKVSEASSGEVPIFGWLMELGTRGDLLRACALFKEMCETIDKLARTKAR